MWSYPLLINGHPVVVFDSDDPDEIRRMVSWCRSNMGKSHGPGVSTWWIIKVNAVNPHTRDHSAIAMKRGPHLFLAQMVWA